MQKNTKTQKMQKNPRNHYTNNKFFIKPETGIFAFWAISREPIKIQTHSASQNDRQNLGFMKDIYGYGKKWLKTVVKW